MDGQIISHYRLVKKLGAGAILSEIFKDVQEPVEPFPEVDLATSTPSVVAPLPQPESVEQSVPSVVAPPPQPESDEQSVPSVVEPSPPPESVDPPAPAPVAESTPPAAAPAPVPEPAAPAAAPAPAPQMSGQTVSHGQFSIMGELDRSSIEAVVRQNENQIISCVQDAENQGLQGMVKIKFAIAKDGSVSKSQIRESTLNNFSGEPCIKRAFRNFQFPEPPGGGIVIVFYPLIFSC